MKRNDILILVALFALWLAWPAFDRHIIKKYFFHAPPPALTEAVPEGAGPVAEPPCARPRGERSPRRRRPKRRSVAPEATGGAEPEPAGPETTAALEDERMRIVVSSRGAGVSSAELKQYPLTAKPDSDPVALDFSSHRALAYTDLADLNESRDFTVVASSAKEVVLERTTAGGPAAAAHDPARSPTTC